MKIEFEYPYNRELPFDIPKKVIILDPTWSPIWKYKIYREAVITGFYVKPAEEGKVLVPVVDFVDDAEGVISPHWQTMYETLEEAESHYEEEAKKANEELFEARKSMCDFIEESAIEKE